MVSRDGSPVKMLEMKQEKIAETPLMKQYFKVKAEHPEAILLFRVGDFYETFADDALVASKVLGIVLTKRANGAASSVPLAGFPHHSIDSYLPKLVRAGYKVAVCDQLEDPKLTKKIVKRGVTELVTPGIAFSDQLLEQKEHNYLADSRLYIHPAVLVRPEGAACVEKLCQGSQGEIRGRLLHIHTR